MYQLRKSPLRRSKFGNKRVKVTMGVTYDSKGEAAYAGHLQVLKLCGEVLEWERQVKIQLRVNGKKICTYVMDFVVTMKDGSIELHEYKGFATDLWKMKWRILEVTLPEVSDRMWPDKEVKMVLVKHH
jgi:hypothetical protein